MDQDQDTDDCTSEAHDRLMSALSEVTGIPAPTVFGDALRRLGDLADGAPSILPGKKHQAVPVLVVVVMRTPDAVAAAAEDLGIPVDTGEASTSATLTVGPVRLHLEADGWPQRVLRRPVEVTPTIEEQAA